MATKYSDILLTASGDIDLTSEDVQLIDTNISSLRQRLNIRFAVWQGEWKFNESFGTPYRSYLGYAFNKAALDAEIRKQILKEPDVTNILSFDSSFDRQERYYSCKVYVETLEEVVDYDLTLRDSFEYVVSTISSDCERTIKYRYLTSQPYNIFDYDYSDVVSVPTDKGTIKERLNSSDYTSSGFSLSSSGTLRDSIQTYEQGPDYLITESSFVSGELVSSFSGTYTIPNEYLNTESNIISGALTDILVTYTAPQEDILTTESNIIGGTLA